MSIPLSLSIFVTVGFLYALDFQVQEGSLGSALNMHAKDCAWHSWDPSLERLSVDAGHYTSCQDWLKELKIQHPNLLLHKGHLSVDEQVFTWYRPEYLSVKKLKKDLKGVIKASLFKSFGFFEEKNMMWVSQDKKHWIRALDHPSKQVHLRALLWIVDAQHQKQLGISPDFFKNMSFEDCVDRLHWMQGEGRIQLLAQPELYVMEGKKAIVSSGEEIPYQTKDVKQSKILFKKALLSLGVHIHHIGESGVFLDVDINLDKASEKQYQNNVAIARQRVKSTLRIPFGKAMLLGGVRQQRVSTQQHCPLGVSSVSWLSSIFCENLSVDKQSLLYVLLFSMPG